MMLAVLDKYAPSRRARIIPGFFIHEREVGHNYALRGTEFPHETHELSLSHIQMLDWHLSFRRHLVAQCYDTCWPFIEQLMDD
ncbi:hypothetical protein TNCV_4162281 [Trichonephila clavipes]|nr:hypothetical protein TNCV_4162281 [Trichonephila clavipes]